MRKSTACILALGSNDGARAWLNGKTLVARDAKGSPLDTGGAEEGTNALMVKIEERGNRWALACRLLPLTHKDISERLRLFDVISQEDGGAVLRPRQSAAHHPPGAIRDFRSFSRLSHQPNRLVRNLEHA